MGSSPQVLIIEDNEALADNMAELLEDLDVEVLVRTSAGAARKALEDYRPALAIIDVGLPDASGVEFTAQLRESHPETEVVLVTGRGTLQSAMEAIRLGAYGYLLKPVDPEGFVQLAERALASVSLRSERRLLAQMLSDSEALHRTVVDAVDACIVGLDQEGAVVFANHASRFLFGDAIEKGVPFGALFEDRAAVEARLSACCAGHAPNTWSGAWSAAWQKRQLRWTLSPVSVERSAPAMVAVGVDVTEQLALRRQAAEKEALAAIGVLTAGLAHEIRNPLNAAQLQLQLLRRRAKAGAEVEKIESRATLVEGELRRLTTLLDDFLGLARPRPLAERAVDVCAILDDVAELEGPLCRTHDITITLACERPLEVYGDADQLRQAVLNLVANARDAIAQAERPGTIRLEARRRDGAAYVGVVDDGPGLGAGDAFEAFHTTKAAGTGLGLSIVRKIVRLHGGEPRLEERPQGGVVASFEIPLRTTVRPGE